MYFYLYYFYVLNKLDSGVYLFSLYQHQGGNKVHKGDPSVGKKKKMLYLIQRNSKNRRLYKTKVTYQNKPKRKKKTHKEG